MILSYLLEKDTKIMVGSIGLYSWADQSPQKEILESPALGEIIILETK